MQYIDMHCDTLAAALAQKKETVEILEGTMVDVARLKEAGAMAQFFAMFLPQRDEAEWFGMEKMPELTELMERMYEIYCHTMEQCRAVIAPARNAEEFEINRKNGKISAFLTIENGSLVCGKMENIRKFYDMGVRLMTLTWNDANCIGYCHSKDRNEMQQGLTGFGKEAVSYMQDLGILVDVSHLSDGGFYDVAEISRRNGKPFAASHSNCRALTSATRNLTDEMIRLLAESGGVAGINFEPTFLDKNEKAPVSRVEFMCDHVCHLVDKGGIECVGIGSDFDGIGGKLEIGECRKMPMLFDALQKRGFSQDAIEKIAWKNVERLIREGMK